MTEYCRNIIASILRPAAYRFSMDTAYEIRVGTVCDHARTVFSVPTSFTTLMTRKVDLGRRNFLLWTIFLRIV